MLVLAQPGAFYRSESHLHLFAGLPLLRSLQILETQQKGGRFKRILKGDLAGSTGTLIGIDGSDGIVKMAANSDIKILDLERCAKLGGGLG